MNSKRLLIIAVAIVAIALFFALDLGQYFTLEAVKARQVQIEAWRAAHPWQAAGLFFVAYGAVAALSLPGTAAQPWLAGSSLVVDAGGFVRVSRSLQSVSHAGVFAAGDCAAYPDNRPKSGVYAVRADPPLSENLLRALRGAPLRIWTPQRRALYLIDTADGSALAAWGR